MVDSFIVHIFFSGLLYTCLLYTSIQNHKTEKECWVVVKRGRPTDDSTFWYIDAVEEALCFGWIDSTTKKIADDITAQKLCPRKPRSNWSELNKERCRRMERLGLMTDAGRAVLPDMSPNGFTIDKDIVHLSLIHIYIPLHGYSKTTGCYSTW